MRVLFFLEPLILQNRPYHYWAWLGIYADMLRSLAAAGHEVRLVANEALAERAIQPFARGGRPFQNAHGLAAEWVIALSQTAVRSIFEQPNVEILISLHRDEGQPGVARYGALLREALADFVPDVMLTLSPAPQLKSAFPDALLLHTETAAYSRAPFPMCMFFDPCGLWDQALIARHRDELLRFEPSAAERELLAAFRRRFAAYFELTTPFAELEAELRAKYARVAFLPLQFGDEPGFDANANFRNQGEYLFHVVENLPDDVALLVVEHPTAHWVGDIIDEETRSFLAEHAPNVRFIDFRSADSAGQYLVQHADFVISVSTSLALQALFFGRPVVSVGHSHLAALAQVREVENIPSRGPLPKPEPELDRLLAWLVSRYFVPVEQTRDAAWLVGFFERSLERARRSAFGPEFFDAPMPAEQHGVFQLLDRYRLRARLANGDFTRWSAGPGPFALGTGAPDDFHTLDFGGSAGSLSRSSDSAASALRLERTRAGTGATLLLQRIPDLTLSAGALARLSFRARGTSGAQLGSYFYLQLADGESGYGTPLWSFELGPEWREFSHTVQIPALGARKPGPGHHLELVFALAREAGVASFELSQLKLEPAAI